MQIPGELKRYPIKKNDPLQGWDSSDELILNYLSNQENFSKKALDWRILIVNDQSGALTCALANELGFGTLTSYTDSYLSFKGIQINSKELANCITGLEELSGLYDLVLIKIPKNMSYFEDILRHVIQHIHSESQVICGYQLKHQANASFQLLNEIIGTTTTSLAKKKARLIFAAVEKLISSPRSIETSPFIEISVLGFPHPFSNASGLFSREKLDIGTRFFLENLPKLSQLNSTVLDLGCANGIIGIATRFLNEKLQPRVLFTDESQMAITSAQTNYDRYFPNAPHSAEFHWTHCCESIQDNSVDWVLCNPPFHQGNSVSDSIARSMFEDAKRVLIRGGTLRVIGNNHLFYAAQLKRIFGNARKIASNSKFTVVESKKE